MIAVVSSLPNVIRLGTITKVQFFNHAPDTSFKGGVCRFRSTRPRSEMFINKIFSAEVLIVKAVNFLRPSTNNSFVRLRVRTSSFVDSYTRT